MKSDEIRKKFLEFFQSKEHTALPSSSLIPEGDSTLIFVNSGMFQFKNVFLGVDKRSYSRATTSQKCVRAGGKHNDLDNVGYTPRHHTFFEMLGNFSFGDYFKKDAIEYAWEFLTKVLGIPENRLFVTVFETDDEAADIWHKQEGVPKDRIFRFGEKDNFWRMGDVGPCGPCSEIFYDHRPEEGKITSSAAFEKTCDSDRLVEIWNLVFMQFYEEPKGTLTPLPKPSVDTGAGLERVTAALNGTNVNYETDLFLDYFSKIEAWTGKKYKSNPEITTAMRVVADHARCVTFLLADGVLPSNDGRGYVLRRILRRGIRYGQKLTKENLLSRLAVEVIAKMGHAYPELARQKEMIVTTIQNEEERFTHTLEQGTALLQKSLSELKQKNGKTLNGEVVFKLYDTYGFPSDLTRLMAEEEGFQVDEISFEKHMEAAKEKARQTWKGATISADATLLLKLAQKVPPTDFIGYLNTHNEGKVVALANGSQEVKELKSGESGFLIADKTCFYAESGGQVGDIGSFEGAGCSGRILNTLKNQKAHILQIEVSSGTVKLGSSIVMSVSASERRATASNHSATHLLHAALRKVLGKHVTQAGSLVEPERLRFDFTHNQSLTSDEIEQIEQIVNQEISLARNVSSDSMSYDKAIQTGAMALFGEKYESDVRVIQMGEFSKELCGGTHVHNTSEIRMFKIVSEGGISAGVRRIEALTGDRALQYLLQNTRDNQILRKDLGFKGGWIQYLEDSQTGQESLAAVEKLREQIKASEKQIKAMQLQSLDYDSIISKSEKMGASRFVTVELDLDDRKIMMEIAERLRDKAGSSVVFLLGSLAGSNPLIICSSKDIAAKVPSGTLLKKINSVAGGKGGGRPDMAQGAIENRNKWPEALQAAREMLN